MTELMSPCGNFDTLAAAIQAGANSVYFGVEKLNMRARNPRNFKLSEIKKVMDICHKSKVRGYLAINTILYDHETAIVEKMLKEAKKAKVDAIIASDMAIMLKARKLGLDVHISTQANISNFESCKFYSKYAQRVVLARELTLPLIKNIIQSIKKEKVKGPNGKLLEVETFCHGALCVAISGRCYMSLFNENASANRGACIQTCRRTYTVKDKETGQELDIENDRVMSPKDLCTIGFLDKLVDAGIHTFKIEGRARAADYVFVTTQCYREALDSIKNKTYSKKKVDDWLSRLETVYNRGFTSGYFMGAPADFWSKAHGSIAREVKEQIGTVLNYYQNAQVAHVRIESGRLNIGDDIMIIGPTTGYHRQKLENIKVDEKTANSASKGDDTTIKVGVKVRRNDQVYVVKKN